MMVCCFALTMCTQSKNECSHGDHADAHAHHDHGTHDHDHHDHGEVEVDPNQVWFGEEFEISTTKGVNEIIDRLEESDSVAAVVKARVNEVCQVKGCWMNITDLATGEPVFVQFKDYGFFMPKDLSGSEVILKGYAYTEMTSVDDLKHFAEDEGKSAEEIAAITEPKEEKKFLASGVKIIR